MLESDKVRILGNNPQYIDLPPKYDTVPLEPSQAESAEISARKSFIDISISRRKTVLLLANLGLTAFYASKLPDAFSHLGSVFSSNNPVEAKEPALAPVSAPIVSDPTPESVASEPVPTLIRETRKKDEALITGDTYIYGDEKDKKTGSMFSMAELKDRKVKNKNGTDSNKPVFNYDRDKQLYSWTRDHHSLTLRNEKPDVSIDDIAYILKKEWPANLIAENGIEYEVAKMLYILGMRYNIDPLAMIAQAGFESKLCTLAIIAPATLNTGEIKYIDKGPEQNADDIYFHFSTDYGIFIPPGSTSSNDYFKNYNIPQNEDNPAHELFMKFRNAFEDQFRLHRDYIRSGGLGTIENHVPIWASAPGDHRNEYIKYMIDTMERWRNEAKERQEKSEVETMKEKDVRIPWGNPLGKTQTKLNQYFMENGTHTGYDLGILGPVTLSKDATVYSTVEGNIRFMPLGSEYGFHAIIDTIINGVTSEVVYAHLSKESAAFFKLKDGDTVTRNQPIGHIGLNGKSSGYHLHYEIRMKKDGRFRPVPPYDFGLFTGENVWITDDMKRDLNPGYEFGKSKSVEISTDPKKSLKQTFYQVLKRY
jgi:murein DD-endopeptidase MepM/ murein hydrolase activator NlpD